MQIAVADEGATVAEASAVSGGIVGFPALALVPRVAEIALGAPTGDGVRGGGGGPCGGGGGEQPAAARAAREERAAIRWIR